LSAGWNGPIGRYLQSRPKRTLDRTWNNETTVVGSRATTLPKGQIRSPAYLMSNPLPHMVVLLKSLFP
jgi:hypothetical protein